MSGQAERPDERSNDSSNEAAEDVATDSAAEMPEGVADSTVDSQTESSSAEEETPASELEIAQAKANENWDRYLRTAAEMENIRKRASRDVENARKFALERFAKELLSVKDSLEMGLASADAASTESLLEGSEATLKLLGSTLQQFGIEPIDPEGEPFDPEQHEAIGMQPSDALEPGSVITVVQKGYSLNGRLLRPAMVVVAAE